MRCVDISIGRVNTVTENSNSGMEEEEICRGKDGVGESSGGLEEEVIYIRTFSLVVVGNGKLDEENSA